MTFPYSTTSAKNRNRNFKHKASMAAAVGDLLWFDSVSGNVKPAGQFADAGTDVATQAAFAALFVGISISTQDASDTTARLADIYTDIVISFPCASATFAMGDYVTPTYSGGLLSNQEVTKTTNPSLAIGRVEKPYTSATTSVSVRITSKKLQGILTGSGGGGGAIEATSITADDSALAITGQASSTANGGSIDLVGGTSTFATGVGGALTRTGGTGGAGGIGGAITDVGGAPASGSAAGGNVSYTGGVGGASGGAGGSFAGKGGAGTASTAQGGPADITGGAGGAGASTGGSASLVGGAGGVAGNGGAVAVTGGAFTSGAGVGGSVSITGGAGSATGTAGSVSINPGAANSGTAGVINLGNTNACNVIVGASSVFKLGTTSSSTEGYIWYDTSAHKIKVRVAAATETVTSA